MAPSQRVLQAFGAMRDLGIAEEKVKPVLKNLLKVYEKNWELIEVENYRALADAIFEADEKEEETNRQLQNNERQNQNTFEEVQEEPERPLKRLRLRNQEGHNSDNPRTETQQHSPQTVIRNREKQPLVQDRSDTPDIVLREANLTRMKDKGKEPLVPQNVPKEKRVITERSSQGIRFKEPKIEPGGILVSSQKTPPSALIKPKDEPITEELPIAVIRPEPLTNGDALTNGSADEPRGEDPELHGSTQLGDGKDKSGTLNEPITHLELANISDESSAKLEVASSPSGEVKMSMSFHGRSDFHLPSIDAVFKEVEDKCMKSYKIGDPNFSVEKLMNNMCEWLFELGTKSDNQSQETVNVTQPTDLLQNCAAGDVGGSNDMALCSGSEPIDIQCDAEVAPSLNSKATENDVQKDITKEMENNDGADHTSRGSLSVVNNVKLDMSKGVEKMAISLINEINNGSPKSFRYIPQNLVFQKAKANVMLGRIKDNCCASCGDDCLKSPTQCNCAVETGGDFVYTIDGLVKEEFIDMCVSMARDPQQGSLFYCKECPVEISKNEEMSEQCKGHINRKFIKECWWTCGCDMNCGNRVVQRGINRNLQVFMSPSGKGWGLRTLEELPKGAFICEYVGEVLTNKELYDRVSGSSKNGQQAYSVLLDADWGSEILKEDQALCLDAAKYGNVARFINHRCFDPNLVEIPVQMDTPDRHYYHLAFFTSRKIAALEELTWDYGIDFDDVDNPIKAFQCSCGSNFCRNIRRSNRYRSSPWI